MTTATPVPLARTAPTPLPPTPEQSSAAVTAEAFEAVLIGQMTQLMMATTEDTQFSGGHGEAMFRGVLAETIGSEIARRGGLGLAPAIMQQIIELQGAPK